ncbi:magnesium transporter [bacterium]|nr:magnesium transporter [bacterium]
MIFLSQLLYRKLPGGGKIQDFAYDPLDEDDYPKVQRVLLNDGQSYGWNGLNTVPSVCSHPLPEDWVLLRRDVQDGMILDLKNRSGTRANDLLLNNDGETWRIAGVDTGLRALLRRLTRGRFGRGGSRKHCLDWKYVEFLRGLPQLVPEEPAYQGKIRRLPAGDIAALTDVVSYLHAAELLMLLDECTATSVFQSLQPQRQVQILGELSSRRQGAILNLMSPDLACELLSRLGVQESERLLPGVESEQRERLLELLRYPAHLASGRMTNDLLTLPCDATVAQARQAFAQRTPRFNHYVYLVNQRGELTGMLTSAQLIGAEKMDQPLNELATSYVNAIPADQSARLAAYEVLRSQLPALPVVGNKGELLGALTVDLAMDTVLPPALGSQMPRIFA